MKRIDCPNCDEGVTRVGDMCPTCAGFAFLEVEEDEPTIVVRPRTVRLNVTRWDVVCTVTDKIIHGGFATKELAEEVAKKWRAVEEKLDALNVSRRSH